MIYRARSHGYEHPYLVANFAQYHRRPPIVPFENFPPALSNKSKSFLIPPAPNSHKRPLHPFSLAVQQLHTCGSAHYTSLLRHTVYTLFKKNEKRGGGRNRRALLSLSFARNNSRLYMYILPIAAPQRGSIYSCASIRQISATSGNDEPT